MISTTTSSVIVYGNGSSYSFNFPFVGVSVSDIQVSYTDSLGNQTVLSPTSYTVTFNSPGSGQIWGIGGTITYPLTGSPIANTTYLTISRVLPLVQNTSISNQGNFYPSAVEAAIDTLCMEIQQVSNRTSQFRGTWITNTIYNIGDIVQDGVHGASTFNLYVCVNGNTSGTWTTDLANGDWTLAFSAASLNPSTGYLPLTGGTISGSLAVSGNVSASNLNSLSSNLTLYVATTGSDSNNGLTSGSPFLTIQHAINIAANYNLNGYTITIQHANGSYAGATVNRPFVNGTVVINGTSSVIITSLLTVQNNALITIQNLEFLPTTGTALQASAGGIAYLGVGIVFGAAAGYSQCLASEGGKIFFNAAYTISGGAASHWYVTDSGEINSQGQTVTLTGTPAFSGSFAHADNNGLINFASSTFTGSATGSRFLSELNASIWDGGAGLTALPGNSAGTVNNDGIYGGSALAALQSANNLSDLASLATALVNLGFINTNSDIIKIPNAHNTSASWIIQFGYAAVSAASVSISYPTAFPSVLGGIFVTVAAGGNATVYSPVTYNATLSSFSVGSTGSTIPAIYWLAIGQ